MGIVNCCFQKIRDEATDWAIKGAMREVGYLIYYKENVKALEDEMRNLERKSEKIKEEMNGKVIVGEVREWLTRAHQMKEEVDLFLQDKNKEYIECFKVSFPDLWSRFRLGREAKKKIELVKKLITDGEFPIVANFRTPSDIGLSTSDDYEDFGTRKLIFQEIVNALRDNAISVVGIWGMPGVGKSTMVRKVGEQVKKESLFDEVAIANVSEKLDVRDIQGQLAADLNLNLSGAEHEKERASLLVNELNDGRNGKKILVILDDVWRGLELKNIGIDFGDAAIKSGCKILLSSRMQDVCKANKCPNPFLIEVLNETEAWNLFKKKAGSCVDDDGIHPIAKVVVEKCGRLPLIIRAVGAALNNADMDEWKDARHQIRNFNLQNIVGITSEVDARLELSYKRLKHEDAQSCFLLCSLFRGDVSIDELVRHAKAMKFLPSVKTFEEARDRVSTSVKFLKRSSFLLEGKDGNTVKMHDLMRDFAVSFASKEDKYAFLVPEMGVSQWPEVDRVYKAISLISENIHELPDKLEYPKLHAIILKCSSRSLQVSHTFFTGLKELKVLNLSCMSVLSLPSSCQDLANLRMLCLTNCKLEDISILKILKNLEILSLCGCNIEILPPEIRLLTRLRVLDLRNCNSLEVIPPQVLSNLSSLEELYFAKGFDNWEAEATNQEIRSNDSIFGEISSLSGLTTIELHASNVKNFLDEKLCERLTRFQISVGARVDFMHSLSFGKKLRISEISVEKRVLKMLMEKAELLYLRSVDMEHQAGHQNGRLPALKSFSNLLELYIFRCGFEYLFSVSIARGLLNLEKLVIVDCGRMEAIVRNESEGQDEENISPVVFPKLKYMILEVLPLLRSFYPKIRKTSSTTGNPSTLAQPLFNAKVAMPALEELFIERVAIVSEIWENQSPIQDSSCQLRVLDVHSCEGLKYVFSPSVARKLERLQNLYIFDCEKMEGIIGEMGKGREEIHNEIVFPQLKYLILQGLGNLKNFWTCGSEKEMSDEVEPVITRSQYFFNHKVLFPSLEKLELSYLIINSTVVSPYLLRRLQNLEELDITECGEVTELFDLEGLKVGDGENGGLLSKLSVLKLNDLPKLNCLWSKDPHGILCFQSLKRVEIVNCGLLRNVFTCSVAGTLEHLRDLQIESCGMMEEIIGNEEGTATTSGGCEILFPKLVYLSLGNLPKLTSFCSANDYAFNMPSLKMVMLGRCPQMRSFTCGQLRTPMMEVKYPRSVQSCGITDLNYYIQQHVFNGKGLAMVSNDYDSAEREFIREYFESDDGDDNDDGDDDDNDDGNDDDDDNDDDIDDDDENDDNDDDHGNNGGTDNDKRNDASD